jgi:hypothetical protein
VCWPLWIRLAVRPAISWGGGSASCLGRHCVLRLITCSRVHFDARPSMVRDADLKTHCNHNKCKKADRPARKGQRQLSGGWVRQAAQWRGLFPRRRSWWEASGPRGRRRAIARARGRGARRGQQKQQQQGLKRMDGLSQTEATGPGELTSHSADKIGCVTHVPATPPSLGARSGRRADAVHRGTA